LPPTVVGFLLLLLFGKNGPMGQLMRPLGFSLVFTWYAAVVTATVVAFPLMYRTTLGAFEQIDESLLQVAKTLGASNWKIFRRIVLPLALPGVLAGLTLAFARALGEFGATLMLAGNIPGQTQTIPMAIYFAVEGGRLSDAWFWVLVIMSLSLSGIGLASLWGRKRRPIEARFADVIPESKPFQIVGSAVAQTGLNVNMQKQLPGFRLDLAFVTGTHPLGVLGGSGAGKTMLLRCIAGVETPTQGQISLNGRLLFDSARRINLPSRQRRIGYLVQNYALFPHLTVAQNIAFGLPKLTASELRQQVAQELEAVQLGGLEQRYPHQLSGGQQQRVALARALASQPEALLLDEPFSALDTHLRSQLEQQMRTRLAKYPGVTLLVTHNLEEAYRICQDLLVMEQGQVIAAGSKQQVFEHPQRLSVAQLTGCKNVSAAVAVSPDQIIATDWGIQLAVEANPKRLAHVGIRAHQIRFVSNSNHPNSFPCWLASTSETPHRITLYLKLNASPDHEDDYHLQAELFKDRWAELRARPFPWQIWLDPARLLLLE
jgi:molybdate ABC transporter permease protein